MTQSLFVGRLEPELAGRSGPALQSCRLPDSAKWMASEHISALGVQGAERQQRIMWQATTK